MAAAAVTSGCEPQPGLQLPVAGFLDVNDEASGRQTSGGGLVLMAEPPSLTLRGSDLSP